MSDFFSNLHSGIKQPDIVMNRGPLPPTSSGGMPPGYDGTPDAKINFNSQLFGNLDPYAYGEPGRLSTQAAYLNIPHVAQRIIPELMLPESQPSDQGGGFMRVNHQVDDGDMAFVIRAMFSPFELVSDKNKYGRQGMLYAIDPVVNLATLNYILHGLQRWGFDKKDGKNWNTLWMALGIDDYFRTLDHGIPLSKTMDNIERKLRELDASQARTKGDTFHRMNLVLQMRHHRKRLANHIIKHLITPFGVPRGSEKQGGQHQGVVNKAVTYPVDFVSALVIDGEVTNLANFWRQYDISAGDDLLLMLTEEDYTTYTLSHNPRSRKSQSFPPLRVWETPGCMVDMAKARGLGGAARVSDEVSRAFGTMRDTLGQVAGSLRQDQNSGIHGQPSSFSYAGPGLNDQWGAPPGGHPHVLNNIRDEGIVVLPEEAAFELDQILKRVQDETELVNILNGAILAARLQAQGADAEQVRLDNLRGRFALEMRRMNEQVQAFRRARGRSMVPPFDSDPSRAEMYPTRESIFQLVPGVSSAATNEVQNAIWREGYWHIARSQIMHFKYDQQVQIANGAHAATTGKLLQATWAPVWVEPMQAGAWGTAGEGGGGEAGGLDGSFFGTDDLDIQSNPYTYKRLKSWIDDRVLQPAPVLGRGPPGAGAGGGTGGGGPGMLGGATPGAGGRGTGGGPSKSSATDPSKSGGATPGAGGRGTGGGPSKSSATDPSKSGGATPGAGGRGTGGGPSKSSAIDPSVPGPIDPSKSGGGTPGAGIVIGAGDDPSTSGGGGLSTMAGSVLVHPPAEAQAISGIMGDNDVLVYCAQKKPNDVLFYMAFLGSCAHVHSMYVVRSVKQLFQGLNLLRSMFVGRAQFASQGQVSVLSPSEPLLGAPKYKETIHQVLIELVKVSLQFDAGSNNPVVQTGVNFANIVMMGIAAGVQFQVNRIPTDWNAFKLFAERVKPLEPGLITHDHSVPNPVSDTALQGNNQAAADNFIASLVVNVASALTDISKMRTERDLGSVNQIVQNICELQEALDTSFSDSKVRECLHATTCAFVMKMITEYFKSQVDILGSEAMITYASPAETLKRILESRSQNQKFRLTHLFSHNQMEKIVNKIPTQYLRDYMFSVQTKVSDSVEQELIRLSDNNLKKCLGDIMSDLVQNLNAAQNTLNDITRPYTRGGAADDLVGIVLVVYYVKRMANVVLGFETRDFEVELQNTNGLSNWEDTTTSIMDEIRKDVEREWLTSNQALKGRDVPCAGHILVALLCEDTTKLEWLWQGGDQVLYKDLEVMCACIKDSIGADREQILRELPSFRLSVKFSDADGYPEPVKAVMKHYQVCLRDLYYTDDISNISCIVDIWIGATDLTKTVAKCYESLEIIEQETTTLLKQGKVVQKQVEIVVQRADSQSSGKAHGSAHPTIQTAHQVYEEYMEKFRKLRFRKECVRKQVERFRNISSLQHQYGELANQCHDCGIHIQAAQTFFTQILQSYLTRVTAQEPIHPRDFCPFVLKVLSETTRREICAQARLKWLLHRFEAAGAGPELEAPMEVDSAPAMPGPLLSAPTSAEHLFFAEGGVDEELSPIGMQVDQPAGEGMLADPVPRKKKKKTGSVLVQADAPLVVPESEVGGSIGSGKGATPFKKVSAKKL